MNDEIMVTLRAVKIKLAEDAGFDIAKLIERIQHEESLSVAQGRTVVQPPSGNADDSRFQQIRFANH